MNPVFFSEVTLHKHVNAIINLKPLALNPETLNPEALSPPERVGGT